MALRSPFAVLAVSLFVVATCTNDGAAPLVPTSITLDFTTVNFVALGQTQTLDAVVRDQNGRSMPAQTVTWGSDNGTVASVNPTTGLVTAMANGTAHVTATLAGGSLTSSQATVTVAQAIAAILKISGDAQVDTVGQLLPTPLTVQVNDGLGSPIANVIVHYMVLQGGGSVGAPSSITGVNGRTSMTWTLGTVSGAAQSMNARAALTTTNFTATAVTDAAASVVVQAGDNQTSPAGLAVPVNPAVLVRDQYNNAIASRGVTFTVASGGGSVGGGNATTNASGIATVGSWTLGVVGTNTLDATVSGPGITGNPVTFTATAATGVLRRR